MSSRTSLSSARRRWWCRSRCLGAPLPGHFVEHLACSPDPAVLAQRLDEQVVGEHVGLHAVLRHVYTSTTAPHHAYPQQHVDEVVVELLLGGARAAQVVHRRLQSTRPGTPARAKAEEGGRPRTVDTDRPEDAPAALHLVVALSLRVGGYHCHIPDATVGGRRDGAAMG